jgi:hypothetical protein
VPLFQRISDMEDLLCERGRDASTNPTNKAPPDHVLKAKEELDLATAIRHCTTLFHFG